MFTFPFFKKYSDVMEFTFHNVLHLVWWHVIPFVNERQGVGFLVCCLFFNLLIFFNLFYFQFLKNKKFELGFYLLILILLCKVFLSFSCGYDESLILFLGDLSSPGPLKRLLKTWTSRYPDAVTDPMHIWDDIITNR